MVFIPQVGQRTCTTAAGLAAAESCGACNGAIGTAGGANIGCAAAVAASGSASCCCIP